MQAPEPRDDDQHTKLDHASEGGGVGPDSHVTTSQQGEGDSSTLKYVDHSVQGDLGETVAPASAVPKKLGRYEIGEKLGGGGYGVVWKAYDPDLDRSVAIKTPRGHRTSPEAVTGLLDEARKISRLEAPGIVPVYDVGREPNYWYIVSKYMSGGSLHQRLDGEPYTIPAAVRLVADIADNLHKAHLVGLVHRDIKPANILLDEAGRPFIADFGLAVTEEDLLLESGGTLGTVNYMSPEQARGQSNRVDARSDVYSLGVVLYRLLTSRLPYVAKNSDEYVAQILEREPRPPRTINDAIPVELEHICLKCLAKLAPQRYSTAKQLSSDLRAWLAAVDAVDLASSGSFVSAVSSSSVSAPSEPIRSSKWAWIAVSILSACVLLALAASKSFWFSPSTDAPNARGDAPQRHSSTSMRSVGTKLASASGPTKAVFQSLTDANLVPFRSYSLLRSEPPTLQGPRSAGEGKRYDGPSETLNIQTLDFGYYELGSIQRQDYTLRVDLRQIGNWTGQAGLFFGLHNETDGENHSARQVGQVIVLARNTGADHHDFPMSVGRYRLIAENGEMKTVFPTWDAPYTQSLPRIEGGARCQFEIRVTRGRLASVRCAGRELFTLRGPELNRYFSAADSQGKFGVMAGQISGVTFHNATIMIEGD